MSSGSSAGLRRAGLAFLAADDLVRVLDALALVGGGRSARIFAAVRPRRCLSTPRTASLVCFASTSAVIPSGSLKTTGCEKPRAKWMSFPFTSALKPTPLISRLRS
jgi:hypothetical protein